MKSNFVSKKNTQFSKSILVPATTFLHKKVFHVDKNMLLLHKKELSGSGKS